MKLNLDCVHYRGEKPCASARLCDGCPDYAPVARGEGRERVLIIKTAALGDVLRTTSILPALRRARPSAHITWLTSPAALPLLSGNPHIDAAASIESAAAGVFPAAFDLIISLDKSLAECALASALDAPEKRGVGLSPFGSIFPFNKEAEYYFSLGLDDDLKFRKNTRSHADMIFEVCGLGGEKPGPPELWLTQDERRAGRELAGRAGEPGGGAAIGLVVGAGDAFANKTPSPEKWAEIAREIERAAGSAARLFILGGPRDAMKMERVSESAGEGAALIPPTGDLRAFAAVVAAMDAFVCGDTLALHIAAAVGVPAVALFGPTCPAEIDMFAGGEKIVSDAPCAPCYKRDCGISPNCMDGISAQEAAEAVARALAR